MFLFISIMISSSQYVEKPHTTPFNNVQINCALSLTIHQGLTSISMQQQQSWLIQVNGINLITAHSEIKHRSKKMLEVIRNYCLTLFLTVVLWEKKPFTCKFNTRCNTNYTTHHLMSNKCQQYFWSLEICMKDKKNEWYRAHP